MAWLGRYITSNFLKIVFHKFYLVYSWILCPIYCISSTQCLTCGYLWSLWLTSLKLTLNLFSSIAGVRIFLWYIQIYLTLISSSSKLLTLLLLQIQQTILKFTGEQQIYRRTPMPNCDFNKVAKFFCKFVACFQNTFSQDHHHHHTSDWLLLLHLTWSKSDDIYHYLLSFGC